MRKVKGSGMAVHVRYYFKTKPQHQRTVMQSESNCYAAYIGTDKLHTNSQHVSTCSTHHTLIMEGVQYCFCENPFDGNDDDVEHDRR